ncbi:hypothetical protein BJ165DRAFT_1368834 [Panaeolus papilionaceus]|nr:hypothetical protein BJ165DRAFT_1368834 [Panaeolus papilionaceus]
MSQIEVSIRPPPRRSGFVSGYPGIPPCSTRPQATIKGAVELKIPPEGVRAKWVRIELHRIERLPTSIGGSERRFEDCVGPGPVTLWSTVEEYTTLSTQRFPFSIRIPESLPPSINMEDNAGIGYELEASVCVAVKARFLPLSKPMVIKSTSPIVIDKHELHSIWPVYLQPETRTTSMKGLTLGVERTQKCYGPGDRITVMASIKSDNDDTTVLQEFEISLIEVTTFKAGRTSPSKRSENVISSGEVALNATLCRDVSYSAELSCTLCPTHATTTLYSARHIDVRHTLSIKAMMDNGIRLNIDLPVVISNWQHDVSDAAIRRIGPMPRLSLLSTNDKPLSSPTEPRSGTMKITPNRHKSARKKTLPGGSSNSEQSHSTVVVIRENTHPGPASTSTVSDSQHDEPLEPSRGKEPWIQWPTVEEEKRLYEQARQRVADIQGPRHAPPRIHIPKPLPSAPIQLQQKSNASLASDYVSASTSTTSHSNHAYYVSAKDEKDMMQRALDAKVELVSPLSGVSEEDGPPPPEYFRLFPNTNSGYLSDKPASFQ